MEMAALMDIHYISEDFTRSRAEMRNIFKDNHNSYYIDILEKVLWTVRDLEIDYRKKVERLYKQ